MQHLSLESLKAIIRDVPDFPKPGILFRDITPLLADPRAFRTVVDQLSERIHGYRAEGIVAIESRGFLFGAAVAAQLGVPLQLVRKPGKLPYETVSVSYELEYGSDRVEMHVDAIEPGRAYAVVDDLIATGGTAGATADLVEMREGRVACCAFVIELGFLRGRERLGGRPVEALIAYD
ncbi:MAG TPA: adenine phosphoribosyltransferase [Kofleriaceae bacterium]|nr:adenine phosphoribosyltransferase [Kofleriaceae bacterium]